MFYWKHLSEVFKNSSWTWKDKARKNEKTKQWWITKRQEEKEQIWWWRYEFLKVFNASLRLVNDACLAIIDDASNVITINDARIPITLTPKLWSASSSYVSIKSCTLSNAAIKSFPFVAAKRIINAITTSIVTALVAINSINDLTAISILRNEYIRLNDYPNKILFNPKVITSPNPSRLAKHINRWWFRNFRVR